jgi:hypothetical protein
VGVDFWNNPIVVSAMRVRFRRSSPAIFAAVYFLALVALGVVFHFMMPDARGPRGGLRDWIHIYLIVVLSIQSLLSAGIAWTATRQSINEEVVNQTLDFQRIVSLSPRQILVGKLLGEPVQAYVLAMASIPLAVWSVLFGGGPPQAIPFVYIIQLTTILMFGSIGLLHSLQPPARRSGGNPGCGMAILAFIVLPNVIVSGATSISHPAVAALFGLTTPIVAIMDVAAHDPWRSRLFVFGLDIPFLLITPISQLFIALVCIQVMIRRLSSPATISLSRPMAYGLLAGLDVITSLLLFDHARFGNQLRPAIVTFWLVHLSACLLLTLGITPTRETLQSWIWRFRRRSPMILDLLIGDRSHNGLALVTFFLIGVVMLAACLVVPVAWVGNVGGVDAATPIAVEMGAAILLFSVFAGFTYQTITILSNRGGAMPAVLFLVVLILINVVPYAIAEITGSRLLQSISLIGHAERWYDVSPAPWRPIPALAPLLVLYGALAAAAFLWIGRWIAASANEVDQKLETMRIGRRLPQA